MGNAFTISFNGQGVEPSDPNKKFELPPPGIYKAKVVNLETTAAAKAERSGEYNTKLTVKLENGMERFMWIPEPVSRTKTEAAESAAAYGRSMWVAFGLSAGASKEALAREITLSADDVLKSDVYVQISHSQSDKKDKDGKPYTNVNIDGFVTKAEYLAAKGGNGTAATVTGTAKPTGGSVASIFGSR